MPRRSPFHARTYSLCESYAWKEWAGYLAVSNYDRHSEREYFALRQAAGLLDVTPLYKYEVTGPDAGAFLARTWSRDIRRLPQGRVVYACMCDEDGFLLDDGTVARIGPSAFRVTTSEPWMHWFQQHRVGLDVDIQDSSDRLAALALQGPRSCDILDPLVEAELSALRFFSIERTQLDGIPLWISRTGYTGDLGYELWTENEHALPLWDALIEAGRDHGVEPVGLDALDVTRIEAGFVLQGIDYVSAPSCLIPTRRSTPFDAGLGWTVKLERDPFVGQAALRRAQNEGPAWALVGLEWSWPELEQLYDSYGLPPHLSPAACRSAVPLYGADGVTQVGQATSHTWSPTLKKSLSLAQVKAGEATEGRALKIEHTVEFERRTLTATVVPRPFYDPPQKTSTPERVAAAAQEGSERSSGEELAEGEELQQSGGTP